MKAQRHAIIEAIERWRTDRERRKLYDTGDPEHLTQLETIAVKIFEDKAKEEMRKTGIKVSDVDREKLTGLAIKAVKENKEFLEEALRQVRFRSRRIGQL